jgi:hypothetical protein
MSPLTLTIFRELVPAFGKPPVTLKVAQKAALDPEYWVRKSTLYVPCRPIKLGN